MVTNKKKLSTTLKITIPIILTLSLGGIVGGIFSSKAVSRQLFQNQSSQINAGWDSQFNTPIYTNSFKDDDKDLNNNDNLFIISAPNYKRAQSLTLSHSRSDRKTNTIISNDFGFNQKEIRGNFRINQSANKNFEKNVFSLNFSKEEFVKQFQNRYKPDLGFLFNISFNAFDSTKNKEFKIDYQKKLMGFSVDDLITSKKNSYKVFSYDINSDYANLTGNIEGWLIFSVNQAGKVSVDFDLRLASPINSVEDAVYTNHPNFSYDVSFPHKQIEPILFWDINQTNDMSLFFWPLPQGPKRAAEIQLPLVNLAGINSNRYSLQNATPALGGNVFSINYQKVNNFSKNENVNPFKQNLMKITLSQEEWQNELYNRWNDKIPSDPGIQVKFNLNFSIDNVQTNNVDQYNQPLFGYFSVKDLSNGKSVKQTITKYDVSEGRENNTGFFILELNASFRLNGSLEISLDALGHNFEYKKNSSLNWNDDKLVQSRYFLSNLNLVSIPNNEGKKINLNELGPKRNFLFDFSSSGRQVFRSEINLIKDRDNSSITSYYNYGPYWFLSGNRSFLLVYRPIYSEVYTLDISNYVENNQSFAKNSTLTFNFAPSVKNNNQLGIYTSNRSNTIGHLKIYKSSPNAKVERDIQQNNNLSNNLFNKFSIALKDLTSNHQNFEWGREYTFWNNNYPDPYENQKGWDNSILTDPSIQKEYGFYINWAKWTSYKTSLISLMRAKYFLRVWLTKSGDYTSINYQIGFQPTAWEWSGTNDGTEASRGSVGFSLGSVDLKINK